MGYEELVAEARKLLRAAIEARFRGDLHANKVRAQAYADGYLRALGDAGLLDRAESLLLVTEIRAEVETEPLRQRIAAAS
ncbi:MAG: hypothetical protein ACHQ53_08390 [Polyangiales bacterium]